MTTPIEQLQESQKLTADALVDLFEITLVGITPATTIYLTNGKTTTFQGNTYNGEACQIGPIQKSLQGGLPRPQFVVLNPANVFSQYAFAGYFDRAQVVRKRILRQHLESNTNIVDTTFWYISQVKSILGNQTITFELRMLSDGPSQLIPARTYSPPTFPWVTI